MNTSSSELADAVKVGIVVLNDNFKIIDVNKEILLKGGVEKKHLIGSDFLSWFSEDSRDEIEHILKKVWSGEEEWGKGSFVIFSRAFNRNVVVDLRARKLNNNIVVTLIDKSWLYETLDKLNIIESAVDHMAEGLVVTDVNGTIIYVNPGFTRITGYSYDEAIGKNPRILKSGKQDKKFYENMWNTILSGKVWSGSLINKRKDGKLYWEEMTIVPIKNPKGKITNFVAVKRDVTERKELETKLQKREEYYRKIFDMSKDGIFIETAEGELVDVNEAGAAMLGYTREELLQLGLDAIIPEEERSKFPSILKELEKKGMAKIEVFNRHKKGYLVPIELSVSLLDIDGKKMIIAIGRDLSYREEMDRKYRILSEMSSDAVILIDDKGIIRYWNPAAEKIFGYSRSEALDKKFWTLIVPPKFLPHTEFSKIIKSAFKKKDFYTNRFEVEAKKKDGSIISVELGVSVFNLSGEKYALAVIRDISERIEMEKRIRRHMEELSSVHRFSINLGSITDLRELMIKAIDELKKLLPHGDFTIGLVNWEKNTIRYEVMIHKGKDIGPVEIGIDPKNSLSGWVVTQKKPLLIRNLDKEKDNLPAKWYSVGKDLPKSWLGVPLMYKDQVIGVIVLQSWVPNAYTQRDLEFLSILGTQLSLAIINAQLYTELKISEEKYRGIIESTIVGITIISLDGKVQFINSKLAQMMGYSPEELIGHNITELTTERGKKVFEEELKRRAEGHKAYYENELITKDGRVITVLINASPMHDADGNIIGSVAVVVDITERKREEEELRKRNAVLNALYNISTKMGEVPSLEDLFEIVHSELKNIFEFQWFFIALYDRDEKVLRYKILKSWGKNIKNFVLKYDPKNSLASWVLKTGKPIVAQNLPEEKMPTGFIMVKDRKNENPKSVVILPITYEKETLGVLSIQHKDANAYNNDDVQYLTTISNALGILIKNIQLFDETKSTKDRLENIINTSIVGISIASLDGTLTFVNDKFAEMLGYSKDELIGKSIMDITTPEGRKIFKKYLKRRGKGMSDYYENVLVRKDGKKINVLINASPMHDADGKAIGSVGIILDITERKRMEEQLLKEKERYRELFESMANIVILIQNKKIVYINKHFEASTGYRAEEVINKEFIEFVHPDMKDIVMSNYKRRISGRQAPDHYVIKLIGKDGKEIWMDIRASVIHWESGKADLVSMIDITYMKEMEDRLIALDEISRKLKMARTKDEVYEIAIENLYKVLNLFNSAIVELKGEELYIVKSRGYVDPSFKININSKRGITAWVARNNLPYYSPNTDEDELYIEGVKGAKCEYATPISIDDKIYGVLDVQKEEPYSISEDDIKLIDLMANNMAVALHGLENQMELEKSKNLQELMLHIVSHDLKNPLAVLNGYVDLLRMDFNKDYLDAMEKAIEEASNIIEKARLFSKLGAGKIDQEKELVNLKEEVEQVASLMSQKYPNGKIKINMGDVTLYAFPLIREVLVNLIDNAFKYGASHVEVCAKEEDNSVEIRVKDDGQGIPEEKKETIFNAFETLSSKKGSGLGLSIVRMIVELHDGSIHVENNKPKGSIFVIQLPKE